jgi:hypothetical protein
MLESLPDLPRGVIGFEAVGEVHAADYEDVLRPAIDDAVESGGVRLVYVLGDRFTGYSGGAGWEDAKLGLTHHRAWQRTALVSDLEWVHHLTAVFGWMMPGEFRRFGLDDLGEAIRWAGADGPDA